MKTNKEINEILRQMVQEKRLLKKEIGNSHPCGRDYDKGLHDGYKEALRQLKQMLNP